MTRKHRCKGFTLLEVLYVIIILSLATAAGATAITSVLSIRNELIRVADAEVLASTVTELVADELRFGQQVKAPAAGDEAKITLDSARYGDGTVLRLSAADDEVLNNNGATATTTKVPAGRLLAENTTSSGGTLTTTLRELLGARSYHDLKLSELTFSPVDPSGTGADPTQITVALAVADTNDKELYRTTFTVTPLNGLV